MARRYVSTQRFLPFPAVCHGPGRQLTMGQSKHYEQRHPLALGPPVGLCLHESVPSFAVITQETRIPINFLTYLFHFQLNQY